MNIAILGTGPIGSTFAFQLARGGHDVTVIARGKRLEQLQAEQAIVTVDGRRAAVSVHGALDPTVAYDLVLVTVLASQVDVVLPAFQASAATTVMFMFNTFESLEPLRQAVGRERFAFGFPAILAALPEGKLKFDVYTRGQVTLSTDARWAQAFTAAGIRTAVHDDIQSWLRTHAVLIAAMMSMGTRVHRQQAGISWAEAKTHALALREGFALVRRVGNAVTPSAMAVLDRAPTSMIAGLCWGVSRLAVVREIGGTGPSEPRTLIDAMSAAAPDHTATLRSIRP